MQRFPMAIYDNLIRTLHSNGNMFWPMVEPKRFNK